LSKKYFSQVGKKNRKDNVRLSKSQIKDIEL